MNILIVDPDRVSRRLAALRIERLGGSTVVCVDHVEALPAGTWQFVLLAADGAAQELQALRRALDPQTKLVAMVSEDTDVTRGACLQAGADEVIVKPLMHEALVQLLVCTAPRIDDFDPATWAELRGLFGADGLTKLCTALVDDLPVQQARFADATHHHDLAALKHIAHALRGVSLQMGAAALAQEWTRAEQAAAAGDAATALPLGVALINRHAALVARIHDETRRH